MEGEHRRKARGRDTSKGLDGGFEACAADDLKAHKNAFNNVMGKKMKEVKDILEEHKRTARIP